MRRKALIVCMGIGAFGIGACGNLSHNDSSKVTAWESIRESEAEALASEISSEREAAETPTMPNTEPTSYVTSLAEYQHTYETIAETTTEPQSEPTTAETTTVEEIIIETTEVPTEAYIEPTEAFTIDDDTLLLKVASCEAGGQGAVGMALVMRTVLNRCEISGASIHDVIYCPDQYHCISSDDWANNYISVDAYAALELIKSGWDESQGATYFCTPARNHWHRSALTYLFTYGEHEFYK